MKIERHKIDQWYADELRADIEEDFARLTSKVQTARERPQALPGLMNLGREVAARGCVAGVPFPRILDALKLAAKGAAAMFATASASPSNPVTVTLDDGPPVTYTSPPNESMVYLGAWITGFYLSLICGDQESLNCLCSVSLESLRGSSTTGPEYVGLYAQSLRDFATGQWADIVKTMLAAVKATDPQRPDISDPDWTVDLHVPQLEVLIYLVTKDAKFGDALARAVELHRKYWSKKKDLRLRDYRGFFTVELTALAKLGAQKGLPFDVESPYLPMELIR